MTWLRATTTSRGVEIDGTPRHVVGVGVGGPDGNGVVARWEASSDRVVATTDALGFAPLFFRPLPGGIALGDRIDELLLACGPAEIDPAAVGATLSIGQPLGEATLFSGVRVLPPAGELSWSSRDGWSLRTRAGTAPAPSTGSRDARIDGYIERFRTAVQRRLPESGRVAVPLSGGADSRHIVLELVRQGVEPVVVTAALGPRDPELRVARLLAERLGLRHVVITRQPTTLAAERRNDLATSWCGSELAWFAQVADHLRGHADVTYDGLGGDVLATFLYQTRGLVELVEAGEWSAAATALAGGPREDALAERFTPSSVRDIVPTRADTLAACAASLERFADEPNPLGWALFNVRTRRHLTFGPHGLLRGITAHTPYLDLDLVDYVRSIPVSRPLDRAFHVDVLRRAFPQHADVPFEPDLAGWRDHVRAGVWRRREALRLLREGSGAWDGAAPGRFATVPRVGFKAFKHVRRALTVDHAAGAANDPQLAGSYGLASTVAG